MKQTIGILAHVDAGKTTFSEQLLFNTNHLRKRGRVDHRDAFLDNHSIERDRGITVFAEQAELAYNGRAFTLIDTPGHADFSPEMERALHVMDAAILLISGADGVQGHTERVWELLRARNIPTFLFLNKMDRETADATALFGEMASLLSDNIFDLSHLNPDGTMSDELAEWLAERDDELLEQYLDSGYDAALWHRSLLSAIREGRVFPCGQGSALHNSGIDEFFAAFSELTEQDEQPALRSAPFAATVYKIRHDSDGRRMTFLKVHAGVLDVRDELAVSGGEPAKVTQLRLFNGSQFVTTAEAYPGDLVAVLGLSKPAAGDVIGAVIPPKQDGSSVPALKAAVRHDPSVPGKEVWRLFRMLDAEDPTLHASWNEHSQEVEIRVMGVIQLEVLQYVLLERFGISVTFGEPAILYKETIAAPVTGYGHFEPLKHYAEVHILLVPAERDSGIRFESVCHTDHLSPGHQRVIEKHLSERDHHGLLTGSPLTDVTVTLLTGRAHNEHTSGGDFREALFRALRQGLEQAENVLLEPYYSFKIKASAELTGRVLTDIQAAHGSFSPPESDGQTMTVTGRVPVATFLNYGSEFASYTGGKGLLTLTFGGYGPCHNPGEVISRIGYDKDADPAYSSSSVFCAKGKGYTVGWEDAKEAMHCEVTEK
ncbi:elongation factor G [Sporosarcina trichiuri]|uniref:elongation factor G n=1 Tax=Sporosarcina trichiuri TaxID=3056445 RepID=UPI0025B4B540|nr:TetM/TetW/TetO/TetS family tetracycline resistance ribosomal protection protein [Sporosarcina sp. 0.2-SM1T-5]WJY27865.1 TetM/TetW/TetO/TetS family tetracycline resistance ribosomal protection protein [Sporosarcina sp. 0.2-SM1T-5]